MANKRIIFSGKRHSPVSKAVKFKVSDLAPTSQSFERGTNALDKAISIIETDDKNVHYILINAPENGYVLKANLCYNLKLFPYSSRQLQVDGYRCRSGETVKVSTCFGYNSLIKFIQAEDSPDIILEDYETAKSELADRYGQFLSFSENNLILGHSVLLRVEIDRPSVSQSTIVLEYLLKSSNQSAAHQRIDQNWTQADKRPISHTLIVPDTVYTELNKRNDTIFETIQIAEHDTVLVCGATNCGKSSLVHHLINRHVSRKVNQSALYLECDPGQTEFAPCGILSLVTVDGQILSPPGSKFLSSDRLILSSKGKTMSKIFGTITPSDHGAKYIGLIQQLLQEAKRLQQMTPMPLFVNTMGWIEDLGLELLTKIVTLARPSHVIRIQSNNEHFISNMKCIQRLDGLHLKKALLPRDISILLSEQQKTIGFQLWYTASCVSETFRASLYKTSVLRREINQLAYLAASLWADISYIPFYAINPTKLPLSGLFVHSFGNPHTIPQSIFDLLNASWVILGYMNEVEAATMQEDSLLSVEELNSMRLIPECPKSAIALGCGIVRTIDLKEECLYILMPRALGPPAGGASKECEEELPPVNLIVLPDLISIPSGLLNEQFLYLGASSLPYIFSYFEQK